MPCDNSCVGIFQFDEHYYCLFDDIVHPLVETHTGLAYKDARHFYESKAAKIEHISEIISLANLVIAEISETNVNVFLEVGLSLAQGKNIVFLVSQDKWVETWNCKLPFDLQGRQLVIYKSRADLSVQLGTYLLDCLYRSSSHPCSWLATDAKSHVQSARSFSICPDSEVWSDVAFSPLLSVRYTVKLPEPPPPNADVRFYLSEKREKFPQIRCIFPWELSEIDPKKKECHIDFAPNAATHKRLQQVAVSNAEDFPSTFDVYVSYGAKNFIFESTHFGKKVQRLVVSTQKLNDCGFQFGPALHIGFYAKNVEAEIRAIQIKEYQRG